jgi:succinate-semialdehyde dehydrogenase/glutarate-semialdehyde dehydrogenase
VATRPLIVFEDADVEVAVAQGAMLAKMRNTGEACTAANRLYGARERRRGVTRGWLAEAMAGCGWRGTSEDIPGRPCSSTTARAGVDELVQDAVAKRRDAGSWVGPSSRRARLLLSPATVLTDVPARGAAILAEEVFGPVAPISTFDHA